MKNANEAHLANARALQALSEQEIRDHFGQYAIFVDGALISYHQSNREAISAACAQYKIGTFSVQRIEPQPIELGVASCADYPR